MKADVQLRGHCPMCGREQAVKGGNMAKHGYTVENGWFNGVCPGRNFAPLELDRLSPEPAWLSILAQADELDLNATQYEQGVRVPTSVIKREWKNGQRQSYQKPWSELTEYDKRSELNSLVFGMRRRAKAGRDFVKFIRELADNVHGKPLKEIERDRSGPIRHLPDPRANYNSKYTACGKSVRYAYGTRYLHMADDPDSATCEACKNKLKDAN